MLTGLKRAIKRRLPKSPGVIEYRAMKSFAEAERLARAAPPALAITEPQRQPRLYDLPDFFGPMLATMALAALRFAGGGIRVLDFGGAWGQYKFYAEQFLPGVSFNWFVVEAPEQAKLGAATYPEIAFHTSLDDAAAPGPFQVAIISGVLQLIERWQDVLNHPAVKGCEFILIARTPVGPNIPYLQIVHTHSGAQRFANHVTPREEITNVMETTHDLRVSFNLDHYMGELGIVPAPAMIWVRRRSM